jgi:hypothetical protein
MISIEDIEAMKDEQEVVEAVQRKANDLAYEFYAAPLFELLMLVAYAPVKPSLDQLQKIAALAMQTYYD